MITPISMKDFRAFKGVSYSRLSNLANGPQAYKAGLEEDPSSSAISLGTGVDLMLTEPDKFVEEIYVMSAEKPGSELMQNYVETLHKTSDKEAAWKASGFNISQERVEKKFATEGKQYYDALQTAGDKKILDVTDMFKANQMVAALKANPFTKKYFIAEDGVELLFQFPITWTIGINEIGTGKIRAVNAKSVLDVIRIDHKNKIIQPIELKTGAEGFFKSFWRWKRYLQGSMYHNAVLDLFWENAPVGEDYKIENIKFVYADTNLILPPIIYNMTESDLTIGRLGRYANVFVGNSQFAYSDRLKYKGYVRLVEELDWHQRTNQWDYSYDVYQNNGEVDIDAFIVKL
jgi:hypothetical protein